jgi:hypothetical protein
MRQLICISILALIGFSNTSFGQNINIPTDSITSLLCKKWIMDYAMMGGTKIGKMPGATESNFEFFKDKTFVLTSNTTSTKTTGTWSYDQGKKNIKLTIGGRSNLRVISLKDDQLEMLADTKDATPDDPMPFNIFYKPGTK